MLSSPAARAARASALGLGRQPIGREAQHDLVLARARETRNRRR